VRGTLSLYLNFINLFMPMLRLAGVRFARQELPLPLNEFGQVGASSYSAR
jgi:hypothetical protein